MNAADFSTTLTCARCKKSDFGAGEKWIFGKVRHDCMLACFCEPCWKELMKDQPVNPNYVDAEPEP